MFSRCISCRYFLPVSSLNFSPTPLLSPLVHPCPPPCPLSPCLQLLQLAFLNSLPLSFLPTKRGVSSLLEPRDDLGSLTALERFGNSLIRAWFYPMLSSFCWTNQHAYQWHFSLSTLTSTLNKSFTISTSSGLSAFIL